VDKLAKENVEGYKPEVVVSTSSSPLEKGGIKGGLNGVVTITVSDNGPGIPESIKDKIFQPFFTTKPTGQGTGLGLSLSYDIIKAHGGELSFTSDPTTGTTFTITFKINES
jgi:signal transduction histidine kinase